jgi:heat shock protein HslJ
VEFPWVFVSSIIKVYNEMRFLMKTNQRRIGLLVSLVIMFLLAACSTAGTIKSSNTITGIVWQWASLTNQTTSETTTVPTPRIYTITFNTDETLEGKADCNNFSGTYSNESGFSITLGATTQAYCGDTSLDQQYLTLLGSVAAGGSDGAGGLALETSGGEQRMLFENGGASK